MRPTFADMVRGEEGQALSEVKVIVAVEVWGSLVVICYESEGNLKVYPLRPMLFIFEYQKGLRNANPRGFTIVVVC